MTTTIADASRLARFLVAADAVAKALSSHYHGSSDRLDGARTYAALAEYEAARNAFVGTPPTPPGTPPWPTGNFR